MHSRIEMFQQHLVVAYFSDRPGSHGYLINCDEMNLKVVYRVLYQGPESLHHQ